MKKISLVLLLAAIIMKGAGQTTTGSLQGNVKTSEGKAAADVTVLLKNTNKGTVTDDKGHFEFKKLPLGNYEIEISLVGYETLIQQVAIQGSQTRQVELKLTLSSKELEEVVIKSGMQGYKASRPSSSLRLQTPLIELPQNIQIVTGKLLADQQIFDMLEGVTRNVSGVTRSEHWDNYAAIVMRGSNIGSFRNGMNVQLPWGPLVEDMSMVERIEFVKGPAGFMLANGEPTGFYNVVTKKPTGTTRGEATFTLGSFSTYRSTLDLDGLFSKDGKLLYRLNLMGQFKGSHRDFDYTNRYSIAPVITYRFNENTSLTAEYTKQYMRMSLIGAAYVFTPGKYADLPRSFTLSEPNIDPSDIQDQSIFLTLSHRISSDWKLTAQLAYLDYKQEGSSTWPVWPVGVLRDGTVLRNVSIWDAANEAKLGQVFINGDVATGRINHRILAGIDAGQKDYMADWNQGFDISAKDGNGDPIPFNIYHPVHGNLTTADLPVFDRSGSLRARANGVMGEAYTSLYAQDEFRFWKDRIRLTLAGRYTSIKQHAYGTYSKDGEFTPRAGISISADKQTSFYALYDQAFVPQQGNDSLNKPLIPVTGNNIEAGIKKDWLGGRWNAGVSVYQIIRNNVVTPVPGPVYKVVQTGQTKTKGIEFDLRGEIMPGLNIVANYAYTSAKISKDEDASKIGTTVTGGGFADHVTNAWLSYKAHNGKMKGFGVSFGYQWQIGRNVWDWGTDTEAQKQLPDYFRLDGSLSWQNDRFGMTLNVNNLLNKYLFMGAPYELNDDPSTTEYYYQTEPGINFRLTLGYKF